MLVTPSRRAAAHVHLAGTLWLIATIAVLVHAVVGDAPVELTVPNVLAAIALLGWTLLAVDALRRRLAFSPAAAGRPGS